MGMMLVDVDERNEKSEVRVEERTPGLREERL